MPCCAWLSSLMQFGLDFNLVELVAGVDEVGRGRCVVL